MSPTIIPDAPAQRNPIMRLTCARVQNRFRITNIIVERNPNHIETDTIEVLTALGVNVEHIVIQHPGLMTTHASLMRTDDNGVEYEIYHALPLWQASLMVQRYQDNKHKQHYWVRHLASDSTTN